MAWESDLAHLFLYGWWAMEGFMVLNDRGRNQMKNSILWRMKSDMKAKFQCP